MSFRSVPRHLVILLNSLLKQQHDASMPSHFGEVHALHLPYTAAT